MALRQVTRMHRFLPTLYRNYSTETKHINVAVDDKSGIATVTLQRPPVNSLNFELLHEFSSTLSELEQNRCKGMILTSSSNSVFSAGLDILEMYKPDQKRLVEFWTALQQVWIKLYGSPFITVAVINGHAPAGGCLLALSCEYRIMLNNFTIGLNETQLGIVAPPWFVASMRNAIGLRQTELALTTGRLFKTDEAFKIGLVDEVVSTKEEGLQQASKFFQKFERIPPAARALTKQALRNKDIHELVNNLQKDLQYFTTFIRQEKVQKGLEFYLESLKQKQKQ